MKIAIKAHPNRGKEVISLLESLGGINVNNWSGDGVIDTYYIDKDNRIIYDPAPIGYKVYTLEEFEKEFPFKVGDKVTVITDTPYMIVALEYYMGRLCYKLDNGLNYNSEVLTLYKEMKEERNITLTLEKAKEWYNEGGELREIALQAYSEEELNKVALPKTWEEFCNHYPNINDEAYISFSSNTRLYRSDYKRHAIIDRNLCSSQKSAEAHLALIQLERLRDCWRQGWLPAPKEYYYSIKIGFTGLQVYCFNTVEFLSFPTREMAEEFLKCFRDLIEKARGLI